jgi:hypothetical protein
MSSFLSMEGVHRSCLRNTRVLKWPSSTRILWSLDIKWTAQIEYVHLPYLLISHSFSSVHAHGSPLSPQPNARRGPARGACALALACHRHSSRLRQPPCHQIRHPALRSVANPLLSSPGISVLSRRHCCLLALATYHRQHDRVGAWRPHHLHSPTEDPPPPRWAMCRLGWRHPRLTAISTATTARYLVTRSFLQVRRT